MKKIVKGLVSLLVALVTFGTTMNVSAATKDDYVALKYAQVQTAGSNQISITGKGIFAVKVGSTVNDANAAIFKDAINPRNFKATFKFDKDYGNGEGVNAGWYSVNFSRTPNWFSSVKSVIQQNDIYGVNITLKLDPMDKKKVYVQPSRYSPGSGFVYLLESTPIDIKKDWVCTLEIKKSKLYVDGTFVIDLDDAFSLAIPEGEAFVGFGGFSESFYDVGMTVTYSGKAKDNDYDNYGKQTEEPSESDDDEDKTTEKDSDKDADKDAKEDADKDADKDDKKDEEKDSEVKDDEETTPEDSQTEEESDTTVVTGDGSSNGDTTSQTEVQAEEYIYVDVTGYVIATVAITLIGVIIVGLVVYLIYLIAKKKKKA